jgi:PIN domain nuclease of toxin-antitoxin system
MKGKVDIGNPRIWWLQALRDLSALPLQILPNYIESLSTLAPIHQDSFDRIIIAFAHAESLTLITADCELAQYASERLAIIV